MLFFNTPRRKYYYVYRDDSGKRKQVCCKTDNRQLAELFVQSLKGNVETAPEQIRPNREAKSEQLLSVFIAEYLQFIEGLSYTKASVASNASALRLLLKRVGDKPLSEITVEECEKFISIGQPSLETAAKQYGHLKAVFNRATKWKRVSQNPFELVAKPRPKDKLPEILTPEDFRRLLDSMPTNSYALRRMRRMILLARDTGMRLSEILHITSNQLNFDQRRIEVLVTDNFTPKSKRPRVVPISDNLRNALNEQIIENRKHSSPYISNSILLFPNAEGKPLAKCGVSHCFHRYARQVFPTRTKLRFHSLRHTFGSMLVEHNVPLARIQKLMGHSTIKMTEKYARLRSDDVDEAIEALNKLC